LSQIVPRISDDAFGYRFSEPTGEIMGRDEATCRYLSRIIPGDNFGLAGKRPKPPALILAGIVATQIIFLPAPECVFLSPNLLCQRNSKYEK